MVKPELLKSFSLFREMDNDQLNEFTGYIQERNYAEGAFICCKGDPGGDLFLIKNGTVSVSLPLYRYDSQYKTIAELGRGNFFGELSFFDGQERSADIQASSDVELLVLSRRDYDQIVKTDFHQGCLVQQKIIAALVGIIRQMNETYSSAGFLL
ncbi:MAG: cyclic nucleotide-binding domain-containing protein [Candidatus Schekmanbacteria bacterium]|nr:cyclic nucleotide-binding domain-containing protein [Candidatus Schekmanbacteria bacterium]